MRRGVRWGGGPTLGIGIFSRPKVAGVIRHQSTHGAVFMRLTFLSGLSEPFLMRCEKHFGN